MRDMLKMYKQDENAITNYKDIRDQLDTFTIVNCIADRWPFRWIGHTAVLYKCQETGQLMVFESTTLNKHTGISGVQLTPFGIWLDKHPGKVYVRIPEIELTATSLINSIMNSDALQKRASAFIKNHLGTSYPNLKTRSGRFKLYLAALDFKIFGKDIFTYKGQDDGLFCTQLVVMMLIHCGVMKDDMIDPHEYVPEDMRNWAGKFDKYFLNNCDYGKEIRIK